MDDGSVTSSKVLPSKQRFAIWKQWWLMARPLRQSFQFAFQGIWHVLKTQRNARIQLCVGLLALALGLWLGLSPEGWGVLILTITLVLFAELMNTALEFLADAACPNYNPLIGVAKDVAAGAVLLAAIGSVVVGLLLLGPPFVKLLLR